MPQKNNDLILNAPPRLIAWELTQSCNLRCLHCRASATEERSEEELSTAEAVQFIESLPEWGQPILILTGGEPLMQQEAAFGLLKKCRERNMHTALDTSGLVSEKILRQATELADLILYDLKSLNDKVHRKYTGVSNKKILENLEIALRGAARVVLRVPLVTGFNDTPGDQQQLINYLEGLENLDQVDILPYHPFGTNKYRRFHKENRQNGFTAPSAERVASLKEALIHAGFAVNVGG